MPSESVSSQNPTVAEQWYRKGASLHDPMAEFDLAMLLFDGQGSRARSSRSRGSLLRESAAAGYVPAMHSLGLLLVRNPATCAIPGRSNELLNDAANAGNWRSSMLLGVLARDGNGVPIDSGAAYYHFRVAFLQGGDEARKLVETDLQAPFRRLRSVSGPGHRFRGGATGYDSTISRSNSSIREGENLAGFPGIALADPANGRHAAQLLASPHD